MEISNGLFFVVCFGWFWIGVWATKIVNSRNSKKEKNGI